MRKKGEKVGIRPGSAAEAFIKLLNGEEEELVEEVEVVGVGESDWNYRQTFRASTFSFFFLF